MQYHKLRVVLWLEMIVSLEDLSMQIPSGYGNFCIYEKTVLVEFASRLIDIVSRFRDSIQRVPNFLLGKLLMSKSVERFVTDRLLA